MMPLVGYHDILFILFILSFRGILLITDHAVTRIPTPWTMD